MEREGVDMAREYQTRGGTGEEKGKEGELELTWELFHGPGTVTDQRCDRSRER